MTNALRSLLPAARQRIERASGRMMTRRSMIAGTAATSFVLGHVSDVLTDPWMEPVREAWRETVRPTVETIDPTDLDQTDIRLAGMQGNPIAVARDIAAETGGFNRDWMRIATDAGIMAYATRVQRRDDGRNVIASHGEGLVLWGEDAPRSMPGTPLDAQPDRKFGRFADRRMWAAMQRRTPALHACRAETIVKGHDSPQIIDYYAWTASDGVEAVSVALTLEQVARGRSLGTPPPSIGPLDRRLLSRDATTPSQTYRRA